MDITLGNYVVRGDDGALDFDGTIEKFSADLSNFIAERETEESAIEDAVNAVFDTHKGTRINMPYLQSQALQHLNVSPSTHKVLGERVLTHVRENANGKGRSLYAIGKGPKVGGCARVADLPPAPPSETK